MEKLLLTVGETADVLSVSRSRVYELIYAEQLDSVKIGRSRRVSIVSVRRFVEGPSRSCGVSSRRPIGSQRALSSGRTGAWSLQRALARPCLRAMTIATSDGWSAPPACAVFGCMTCGTPLLRLFWPRA